MKCVGSHNKLHSAPLVKGSVGVLCYLIEEIDCVLRIHGVGYIMRCGNMIIVSWPCSVSHVCTHCGLFLFYIPC